ncbi:hypothetical protein WR25_25430 [Diploscapter pachys]|uniref:Uncharacterized protein n=1 Tax=Diploscapter pachys TaxID=2018661 RepID=A0A2A2JGH1_9BILA|nr:hypothetical protein WR25_25430 [Diploscapter pachys]
MSCRYLNYSEIVNLAWTNRRMMNIVRRNYSTALEETIQIDTLDIDTCKYETENELFLTMCRSQLFKKYRRVSFFKARIRSAQERRESEEFDNKLMRLFGRYLRYCTDPQFANQPFLTWFEYALNHKTCLNVGDNFDPIIDFNLFIRKVYIRRLSIDSEQSNGFWNLIRFFDTNRSRVEVRDIHLCPSWRLEMANRERFEKSPFLQERLTKIGMRMCPLAHELMKMNHFKDTVRFNFPYLDSDDICKLLEAPVKSVNVGTGSISLKRLLPKLLSIMPFKREWEFPHLNNLDNKWAWDTISEGLMEKFGNRRLWRCKKESYLSREFKIKSFGKKLKIWVDHTYGLQAFKMVIY